MEDLEPQTDKESFLAKFSSLRPDLYFPEGWTEEQKAEVVEAIRPATVKTSIFSSIPMRCYGRECEFADTCPILAKNLAPVGNPCPIEMATVQQFMADYMYELGVDPENLIEVSMIRDLVDQEVQYLRKTKVLAKEHFIQENVVGVDPEGTPIMKKELHMAVELEDRLHKRKRDLRNQLLATREARAKIGQTALDSAQVLANVLDSVRELDAKKAKARSVKLGRLYRDDDDVDDAVIDIEPEE